MARSEQTVDTLLEICERFDSNSKEITTEELFDALAILEGIFLSIFSEYQNPDEISEDVFIQIKIQGVYNLEELIRRTWNIFKYKNRKIKFISTNFAWIHFAYGRYE